jgi:hypothetical protein
MVLLLFHFLQSKLAGLPEKNNMKNEHSAWQTLAKLWLVLVAMGGLCLLIECNIKRID